MGKNWDKAVPPVSVWKECLRVLKPGAFCFVMSAPRQDCLSRMICNLSDAGFRTDFTSIYWTYASGFPKAGNIGKLADKRNDRNFNPQLKKYLNKKREEKKLSLNETNKLLETALTGGGTASALMGDKKFNEIPTLEIYTKLKTILDLDNRFDELIEREEAEREVIGERIAPDGKPYSVRQPRQWTPQFSDNVVENAPPPMITTPATPQAKALDGSYSFNPKPAVEIILVCQKPMTEKTYVGQALAWYAQNEEVKLGKREKTDIAPGCVNFDDCRVPVSTDDRHEYGIDGDEGHPTVNCYGEHKRVPYKQNPQGRFPSNLLCSDDVLNDDMVHKSHGGGSSSTGFFDNAHAKRMVGKGDSGSYSRYFDLDAWWNEQIKKLPESVQKTFPFLIVPKSSKAEKNKGLEEIYRLKNDVPKDKIKEIQGYLSL